MHRDKLVPQDHLDHKDPLEALYVPLHAPALFQYVLNAGEYDRINHVYGVIYFLQPQGDDGADGEDGTAGAAGEQGSIGPHGPPGPPGDPGPPVTITTNLIFLLYLLCVSFHFLIQPFVFIIL